jgi:hypothetical protein
VLALLVKSLTCVPEMPSSTDVRLAGKSTFSANSAPMLGLDDSSVFNRTGGYDSLEMNIAFTTNDLLR